MCCLYYLQSLILAGFHYLQKWFKDRTKTQGLLFLLSCNDLLNESFNINTVICKMMKYIYIGKYVWKTKGGILTLNFRT